MINDVLTQIVWGLVLLNVLAMAVLLVFFINARINLKRQIDSTRFFFKLFNVTKEVESSYEAAERMGIDIETFSTYCQEKGIETPEARVERINRIKKGKEEQERRILEEEAAWRAEQDRVSEERRRAQEEEARKRRERLKKFGFK